MGNSTSHIAAALPSIPITPAIPADAYICKYNKESFNSKLNIIRDAHNVSQYYASILLSEKLPLKLSMYLNYNDLSEEYFNPTRKIILTDLDSSYYQYYQYLNTLKELYEQPDNSENDRRKILTDIFNKCYIVQKYIIEDLWDDCNEGNGYPITIQD